MLWSFVTHAGTAGAGTGVLLRGTVDFSGVETQKISQEPLGMTCSVAKRQEKLLELGARKNLRAIPEVFFTCSEGSTWEATAWEP